MPTHAVAMRSSQQKYMTSLLVSLIIAVLAKLVSGSDYPSETPSKTSDNPAKACTYTKGNWCTNYHSLQWQSFRPVPRGSKTCPNDCSGIGNCHADIGQCQCPAGYTGDDCSKPQKRPCTHFLSRGHTELPPRSHTGPHGRDLNWTASGWTPGRCAGYCDEDIGMCWCDVSSKYGHLPNATAAELPYHPNRTGRPLADDCHLGWDERGNRLDWGERPFQHIYGRTGWCNADEPPLEHGCGCVFDGQSGHLCTQPTEMFCQGQCSGHGECHVGFCKCHRGWYGADCSRKVAGADMEAGLEKAARPWIKPFVGPAPAAQQGTAAAGSERHHKRKRPFIYVYDVPPEYTTNMLQYRLMRNQCAWRQFYDSNRTEVNFMNYHLETLLHELLLQSPHRTFDPEEADFFYVPVYTSCFIFPVYAYLDWPWFGAPRGPRPYHASMMALGAKHWLQATFPYWNRTGGADHIWLFTHDEGACWAPSEIANSSILLTHWGRLDLEHSSNTAYFLDNYSVEHSHPTLQPGGWQHLIKGHPCYDPAKDLVMPVFKPPKVYSKSPYLKALDQSKAGAEANITARDILLFLRGDVGKHREPNYSRGIRQRAYKLATDGNWKGKYSIMIGDSIEVPGDYSELLARSRFCLVVPGDGWSARAEDAVLHGCIPVVIMDNVHAVWESVLEWSAFSIRVNESQVDQLPQILQAVTTEQLQAMQAALAKVWQRFTYFSHWAIKQQVTELVEGEGGSVNGSRLRRLHHGDALHTLIQWLSGRMKQQPAS